MRVLLWVMIYCVLMFFLPSTVHFLKKVLLKDTSIFPTAINMFFILEPLFPYISIHCKIHLVPLIQHRSCINPSRILTAPLGFVAAMAAWQSPSHLVPDPPLGHPSGQNTLQRLPKSMDTDLRECLGRAVVFFSSRASFWRLKNNFHRQESLNQLPDALVKRKAVGHFKCNE